MELVQKMDVKTIVQQIKISKSRETAQHLLLQHKKSKLIEVATELSIEVAKCSNKLEIINQIVKMTIDIKIQKNVYSS